MSKTRLQRKRDLGRILYTAALILALIGIAATLTLTAILWGQVEEYTREYAATQESRGPAIYAADYLPEDFDLRAYEAAKQRYDVENDLIIPHFTAEGGR